MLWRIDLGEVGMRETEALTSGYKVKNGKGLDAEGDGEVNSRPAGHTWVAVPELRGFLREDPAFGLRHLEGASSWRRTRRVSAQPWDTRVWH